MNKIKLFCLPYAGGSAMAYLKWKRKLHPSIELIPVELAGRGQRSKVALYQSFNEAIDDTYNYLKNQLTQPFAFYGHSMGSLLAHELSHRIKKLNHQEPVHIFVSGRNAPHRPCSTQYHTFPEAEFRQALLKMGGTSQEILENKELCDIYLPILRADLRIHETYEYTGKEEKLNCPITVFNGKEDPEVVLADQEEWGGYTTKKCHIYNFDSGHFFINEYEKELIDHFNQSLIHYI